MSSTASSTLTLELKPSWPLLGLFLAWLVLLVAAIHMVDFLSWPAEGALDAAVLLAGGFLMESQLPGLSSRALKRISVGPDGGWLLADGRGAQWAAELHPDSRSLGGVMFLRWRSCEGCHWALVTGSRARREALRRLRVRLRLGQSHECC